MSALNFQEYDPKIKNLIDDITNKAELSVIKDFPTRIDELDKILQDERLDLNKTDKLMVDSGVPVPFVPTKNSANGTPTNKRKRTSSETDSGFLETTKGGTKVLVLPNGSVPSNHHIEELIKLIQPKIFQLIDYATKLRMWILFLIPKIEDGNNFGVSIQEDTLSEIKSVEDEAATYFEQFSIYYITRAKAISRICKFPHIEDFRKALKEIDRKQILVLRLAVREMKNHYASIYDLVFKNYDKIKMPKSNNASIMF